MERRFAAVPFFETAGPGDGACRLLSYSRRSLFCEADCGWGGEHKNFNKIF
jgi:hypothetical protein